MMSSGDDDNMMILIDPKGTKMAKFGMHNRGGSKMTALKVEELRREYELGATQAELGRKWKLSVVQVGRIVRGESWGHTGIARRLVMGEAWEGVGSEDGGKYELPDDMEDAARKSAERVKMLLGTENPFADYGGGGIGAEAVSEEAQRKADMLLGKVPQKAGEYQVELPRNLYDEPADGIKAGPTPLFDEGGGGGGEGENLG